MNKQIARLMMVLFLSLVSCVSNAQAPQKRCREIDTVQEMQTVAGDEFDQLDDIVGRMDQSGALDKKEPGKLEVLARRIGIFLLLKWFDFKDYVQETWAKLYALAIVKRRAQGAHGRKQA